MKIWKGILGVAMVSAALASGTTQAAAYAVTVSEGLGIAGGFNTANGNPYSGSNTASATFTYTGALNFDDSQSQNGGPSGDLNSVFGFSATNVSGYAGSGTVTQGATPIANFNSLANFLGSSGSASNYQYGSYYTFDLGVVAAGTVLTITHDDGVSLFQGGTEVGSPSSGPTSEVTDTIDVTTTGDTILRYSRQNGTPSILEVSVPEPGTFALLGAGLLGLCFAFRRRPAAGVSAAA